MRKFLWKNYTTRKVSKEDKSIKDFEAVKKLPIINIKSDKNDYQPRHPDNK